MNPTTQYAVNLDCGTWIWTDPTGHRPRWYQVMSRGLIPSRSMVTLTLRDEYLRLYTVLASMEYTYEVTDTL